MESFCGAVLGLGYTGLSARESFIIQTQYGVWSQLIRKYLGRFSSCAKDIYRNEVFNSKPE